MYDSSHLPVGQVLKHDHGVFTRRLREEPLKVRATTSDTVKKNKQVDKKITAKRARLRANGRPRSVMIRNRNRVVPARGQDDFVRFELSLLADQSDVDQSFVLQQHFDGVHHVDQVIVPPETVLRRVHIRDQLRRNKIRMRLRRELLLQIVDTFVARNFSRFSPRK